MSIRKVVIIGLGYVGLPLACLASKSYDLVGIDVDASKVEKINSNICPIAEDYTESLFSESKFKATSDFSEVASSDIVIICVPTPVDNKNMPNLEILKSAVKSITSYLRKGQIIVVESTVFPGTCEEVLYPIIENNTKFKVGRDLDVAYCPERIDPGNKKWHLENIPRVLGASSEEASKKVRDFYKSILKGDMLIVNSIKSAEAIKIMENTFRDINIAFINEMAMSFEKFGIDIIEVIKGASTKPFAFLPHYPGPGVGGHCIPVDPYYLIGKAKSMGFNHKFLQLAREINSSMPEFVVGIVESQLMNLGLPIKSAKIGLLGYSYKRNTEDVRNSPAITLIKLLKARGAEVLVFDPHIKEKSDASSLPELLKKVEIVLVATDHDEFINMDTNLFKENNIKIVFDPKNCLDKGKIVESGVIYKGLGGR